MKTLVLSLSLREDSLNRKLVALAANFAKPFGAEIEFLDLRKFPLPAFDQDIETGPGIPALAQELHTKMAEAKAYMIASPEYNLTYPGHFKNTIDWLSRLKPIAWSGKPMLFLSASPSLVGGNRGLWHLRPPLEATGAFVYPNMYSLAKAHEAFDAEGNLPETQAQERLKNLVKDFFQFAKKMA